MAYEWQTIDKPPDHDNWIELKTSCFLHKIRGYCHQGDWYYEDTVDEDYLPLGVRLKVTEIDFREFIIGWRDVKPPEE